MPSIPETLSANAKHFLEACLQSDYRKRSSAHKLLSHALVEHVKYHSMTHSTSADLLSGYARTLKGLGLTVLGLNPLGLNPKLAERVCTDACAIGTHATDT